MYRPTPLPPRHAPWLLAICWLLIASLAASVAGAEEPPRHRLQPGDEIAVRVHGHPDLSGEFALDGGGAASLPLLGRLTLAGTTIPQAEARIVAALRPDYLIAPTVSVRLLVTRPIYVLGEVEAPGSYPFRTGLTVMEAVALAGGYSDRADDGSLSIVRARDPARLRLPAAERTRVLPGDTVRVGARFF